jgi:21S rRNA (GM2251-2'-O)-methyltransferase
MQSITPARRLRLTQCCLHVVHQPIRPASLTGAIQRGARKARDVVDRVQRSTSRSDSKDDSNYAERGRSWNIPQHGLRNGTFPRGTGTPTGSTEHAETPGRGSEQMEQYLQRIRGFPRDRRALKNTMKVGLEQESLSERKEGEKRWIQHLLQSSENPNLRFQGDRPLLKRDFRGEGDQGPPSYNRPVQSNWSRALKRDFRGEGDQGPPSYNRPVQSNWSRALKRDFRGEGDQGPPSYNRPVQSNWSRDRAERFSLRDRGDMGDHIFPKQSYRSNTHQTSYPGKSAPPSTPSPEVYGEEARQGEQTPKRSSGHSTVPLSVPRSVAASEFIYGTSAVKAAIQAGSRKLYKLYVYGGVDGTEERDGDREIIRIANEYGLPVKRVGGDWLRVLDKMAQGRPHNGYVMEASQLPIMPIEALNAVVETGDSFSVTPGHQSTEEIEVNGTSTEVKATTPHRQPFVLMLDNILDPGNVGAIIRSAAFFGVDAIVLINHSIAPFSPVTLKAASGAAEYMRYFRVKSDFDFVKKSQSNGWAFYAGVAPGSASARRPGSKISSMKEVGEALDSPCVLVLGGEGEGLRPRLQKAIDHLVGIDGAKGSDIQNGLDSLNVSVAAALMIQAFVKRRLPNAEARTVQSREGREAGDRIF